MSKPKLQPIGPDGACLVRRVREEADQHPAYIVPLHVDLSALMALVGCLQLALRHPANTGPSAAACREIIDLIITRLRADGLQAHAELAALGNDPRYDS